MKSINSEKLILASKSPRRKELLEQIGIKIIVSPSNINEAAISNKDPETHVRELAFLKAENTSVSHPASWIIGADTIVVVKDQILGKPKSKPDAIGMLNKLSNCEHSVYTAFCVINQTTKIKVIKSVETKVTFKCLTNQEIYWYVKTNEHFDKAGSYAIQGMGAFLVRQISGSYSNVVGLPVCEVVETLMNLNLIQF